MATKNTVPSAATAAITQTGVAQPPQLSARLPQTLPDTDTPM